ALSACEASGNGASALILLKDMKDQRLQLDVIGASAAMSSLSQTSLWEQSLENFQHMAEMKIESNSIACNALVAAWDKGGRWQSAVYTLGQMEWQRV
ncbi:rluD, partial [Symbiodinium pilosum]